MSGACAAHDRGKDSSHRFLPAGSFPARAASDLPDGLVPLRACREVLRLALPPMDDLFRRFRERQASAGVGLSRWAGHRPRARSRKATPTTSR